MDMAHPGLSGRVAHDNRRGANLVLVSDRDYLFVSSRACPSSPVRLGFADSPKHCQDSMVCGSSDRPCRDIVSLGLQGRTTGKIFSLRTCALLLWNVDGPSDCAQGSCSLPERRGSYFYCRVARTSQPLIVAGRRNDWRPGLHT